MDDPRRRLIISEKEDSHRAGLTSLDFQKA